MSKSGHTYFTILYHLQVLMCCYMYVLHGMHWYMCMCYMACTGTCICVTWHVLVHVYVLHGMHWYMCMCYMACAGTCMYLLHGMCWKRVTWHAYYMACAGTCNVLHGMYWYMYSRSRKYMLVTVTGDSTVN